jgi:UDP-2,3-diacylglucosamine pyrophosphatase LpxH
VLSLIRKLSDRIDIIWLCGNHDASAEIFSNLLGTTVMDEYVLHSGDRDILVLHGHIFDEFLDAHPWVSLISDMAYWLLLRIDTTHTIARFAKKTSKKFLRCSDKIEQGAIDHARQKKCTAVCCGHTHHPVSKPDQDTAYFNSGCWTESPCHYLAVHDGIVELRSFVLADGIQVSETTEGLVSNRAPKVAATSPAGVATAPIGAGPEPAAK